MHKLKHLVKKIRKHLARVKAHRWTAWQIEHARQRAREMKARFDAREGRKQRDV